MSVTRSRIREIIKEEVARGLQEAMSPEEKLMRRREQARASRARAEDRRREAEYARMKRHDVEQLGYISKGPSLQPGGPLPGMMSYDPSMFSKAYIDRRFAAEAGISSPEDVISAVETGRAKVWSAGMIGGAQPPSMTIVPPDVKAGYNEMTGEKGYPYVYTRNAKDEMGRSTHDLEVVIQRGIGYGGYGPSAFTNDPRSMLGVRHLQGRISEVVPIDLLGGNKGEVVDVISDEGGEPEMGGMPLGDLPGGDEPLTESVKRWNVLAGIKRS
jgi:hypothetical protein